GLDAERRDADAGPLRHDQVHGDRAVLLAAAEDVAGLKEYRQLARVFDREGVDLGRLVDDHLFLLDRLLEGEHVQAGDGVGAVDQEDGQVAGREWTGDLFDCRLPGRRGVGGGDRGTRDQDYGEDQ